MGKEGGGHEEKENYIWMYLTIFLIFYLLPYRHLDIIFSIDSTCNFFAILPKHLEDGCQNEELNDFVQKYFRIRINIE